MVLTVPALRVTRRHSPGVKHRHPAPRSTLDVSTGSYEIRIRGLIGDGLVDSLGDFDAQLEPAETVLRGEIRDQAELHGLLARIESLGLELVEVRQIGRRRVPS
jgi:hypothetical protein